ncbi:hypothetical protein THTE_0076 [Thermogutta terrifontis]|uniref:Uncharacterized protein n=1 Tax=Thermogutta terrifontis TaxID=1331910 RepID=A0A286R9N9_9BACT|nr:hypothetical protein [Thermogutta terrifontis]ASV72678.1 hypothetical protein THTE_0076 [Thermogutta terrifontis]
MRWREKSPVHCFAVLLAILLLGSLVATHPFGVPCAWASDGGPILFAPSEAELEAGNSSADARKDSFRTFQSAEVQPRVGDNRSGSASSSAGSDGWFAKGQSTGRASSAAAGQSRLGTGSSGSVELPPAMIPAPQNAVPLTSGVSPSTMPSGTVHSPSVVPYPYGTPAPVPPLQEQSRPLLGTSLPRLFGRNRTAEPSPLARWWNSLWGKTSASVPSGVGNTPVPPGTIIAGSGSPGMPSVWSGGGSAAVAPAPSLRGSSAISSGGSQSAQGWSAYAVPYALPPSGSSPTLVPPPHTATPALQTPAVGAPSGVATGVPNVSSGTVGSPSPISQNTFSDGWAASTTNPPATASGTAIPRPSGQIATPRWPSATAPGAPSPPYPGTTAWGTATPGTQPSLWERIRNWWADVTAPKGVQGRAALLPSAGQARQGIFRTSPPPASDPFTSRTVPVPSSSNTQGSVLPGGSPAVLPPPAPQLPLRQAW